MTRTDTNQKGYKKTMQNPPLCRVGEVLFVIHRTYYYIGESDYDQMQDKNGRTIIPTLLRSLYDDCNNNRPKR